ncbi:MAG: hypothetical protein LQ340_005574 [Diploschistes diacapsis]|nr:MAG: hypothetical protein LQ340_005574 [Diploschistes diacapsis]
MTEPQTGAPSAPSAPSPSIEFMASHGGLSPSMQKKLAMLLPMYPKEYLLEGTINLSISESWTIHLGGNPSLLVAFAGFFNRYFRPSLQIEPTHITTMSGSGNGLDAIVQSICEPGDAVLIAGPCWPSLSWSPTPSFFLEACTPAILPALESAYASVPDPSRIRALLVCNPQNPAAMCYDAETLRGLMQFRAKKGLHMVSDEVYALSILEGEEGEGAEGKVETRGGGMVNKRLGFVSALEAVGGTVEGKEANDVNDADPAFDLSRLHVVWSLSKDLGSTGVRMQPAKRPLHHLPPQLPPTPIAHRHPPRAPLCKLPPRDLHPATLGRALPARARWHDDFRAAWRR